MSVWTATPIARPPELRLDDLLGEHDVAVVVAALAAVLLGVGEAEEAELAHAREDPVGEGLLSSHSSACGASSFSTKRRIDSRSWSCSSVKMKCFLLALKSGFRTRLGRWPCGDPSARKVGSPTPYFQCFPRRTTQMRRASAAVAADGARRADPPIVARDDHGPVPGRVAPRLSTALIAAGGRRASRGPRPRG